MAVLAIVIRIVIFLLVGLGGLFCLMATAGNYWINKNFLGKSRFHSGLWKSCPRGNCASFANVNGIYQFQLFLLLAVISKLTPPQQDVN